MKIEKLDILTLNDSDYAVLEILPNKGKEYYCLVQVDENENPTNKMRIMYWASNNGKMGLSDIKDETELKEIKELIKPMLEIDYNK